MSYDPALISRFFDEYGEKEWERLVSSPKNLMSLEIHLHYLQKYVNKNDYVLELGAGAGRFTIELAKIGAKVLTSDISEGQLKMNREKVVEKGLQNNVEDWKNFDITDLGEIADNSFDRLVVYGGPLSYVLDKRKEAMDEMLRVTKPRGIILLGVMSRYGAMQRLVHTIAGDFARENFMAMELFESGDDLGYLAYEGHHSHLFTWEEMQEFLSHFDCKILEATATSYLSSIRTDEIKNLVDTKYWQKFVELELEICKKVVDGGSHMIVVICKT